MCRGEANLFSSSPEDTTAYRDNPIKDLRQSEDRKDVSNRRADHCTKSTLSNKNENKNNLNSGIRQLTRIVIKHTCPRISEDEK